MATNRLHFGLGRFFATLTGVTNEMPLNVWLPICIVLRRHDGKSPLRIARVASLQALAARTNAWTSFFLTALLEDRTVTAGIQL